MNYQTIEEKCELIESQLLPLKLALNDSNMVEFVACISQNDRTNFSDYIWNQFLPICNSSRRYKFQIWFYSDANSDTNVISSILERDEIKHCSNIEIEIIGREQKRLPVEEISNWLELSADVNKNNLQNPKERFLKIFYYGIYGLIQNAREMIEHLAKVYFIYFWTIIFLICSLQHNNIYNYNYWGSNWSYLCNHMQNFVPCY